jgi:hypothetical protein
VIGGSDSTEPVLLLLVVLGVEAEEPVLTVLELLPVLELELELGTDPAMTLAATANRTPAA